MYLFPPESPVIDAVRYMFIITDPILANRCSSTLSEIRTFLFAYGTLQDLVQKLHNPFQQVRQALTQED